MPQSNQQVKGQQESFSEVAHACMIVGHFLADCSYDF
jgi:hypothetical protein